ncbi:endonuclease [Agrobacterium tumefaciens]|uniref:Endonuclease n=1 Tax=Agrobacterium tumefaciens TaxID=358 RepID=A0AA44JB45_AGRTU|nr:endonuclease [Agrobacterium tumefaciens]NTC17406.1 endonuclease [Agrobacterium tumefaciens]NTC30267.1 endonuclease [Agrobacterium tumefaciens]
MPVRAPRICKCGKVVPSGVICPCVARDNRDRKARFDLKRPAAHKRGYDSEWRTQAKAFLAIPGNDLCECGAPAVLVRHAVSIKRRPDLRMVKSNWRPGCQRCNAIDAAKERLEQKGKTS